ncbi:MarR family winged helix-turn-helix transcriptional regulator [Mycolicibacterium celeriflavum]|uniref:MarR family winged helix-turn-helix transcriptional regulator n=1 Tax=Mycolicibacterium celeriflavum TaxID=1249101 RepID=UPI003CE78A98
MPSRIDPLALEQQVCFALAVTHRAVLAIYRPLLEPLGLTHPQYLVMLALWDHYKTAGTGEPPAKPLSVKDVARALQLDSATLSPMLKRLESLGFITRARSAVDERATDVRLTDEGVRLRQRALNIPLAVVERLGVDLDELETLRNVLNRVNTAALAAGVLDT